MIAKIFQSTPPRRRRHRASTGLCDQRDFNPRLREGGDIEQQSQKIAELISIHASAKEATVYEVKGVLLDNDFNPRLREGGDDEK